MRQLLDEVEAAAETTHPDAWGSSVWREQWEADDCRLKTLVPIPSGNPQATLYQGKAGLQYDDNQMSWPWSHSVASSSRSIELPVHLCNAWQFVGERHMHSHAGEHLGPTCRAQQLVELTVSCVPTEGCPYLYITLFLWSPE